MTWAAVVLVWVAGISVELVDLHGPYATRDECRARVTQMMTIGEARGGFSALGQCVARARRS